MDKNSLELDVFSKKHIKSANNSGFLHPISSFKLNFIEFVSTCNLPSVDLGCSYGSVPITVARYFKSHNINNHIYACDCDPVHINFIDKYSKKYGLDKYVKTASGKFPYNFNHFANNSIGAILVSFVLPYLSIDELELGLTHLYRNPSKKLIKDG